jgi:death-on-curing protein
LRARAAAERTQSDSTIPELVAAYAYDLAKNHDFVDGNKRVAFLALGLFLAINGKGNGR